MKFVLHGATLALAWFLIVNLILSALAAWAAAREIRRESAAFWFAIRMLPGCIAVLFVAAVFVPSYWRYEPRNAIEDFDLTLIACAMIAAGLLGAAAIRGLTSWWHATSIVRRWMQNARPLCLEGTSIGAFEVDVERPMMALVGVLRPRLLVTRGLMKALSDEELSACVAHELGHSSAFDNLKRLAMRAAPDALFATSAAREIERRWASASEHAADDAAGHLGIGARCALASALVKVARLIPGQSGLTADRSSAADAGSVARSGPISPLVGGSEIASRVRRLLENRAPVPAAPRPAAWILSGVAVVAIGLIYGPLLQAVHVATEIVVQAAP
jgi:Zn-dependent protease with chaperone function